MRIQKSEPRFVGRREALIGGGAAMAAAALPRRARAQAPVLRLGVLTDLSGPYRDTGGPTSVACVRQAVADFKAMRPDLPVEVLVADHQQKPDVASGLVREWFDNGGVDAAIEVNNSAIALAVNAVVAEKNKIQLNSGALSSDLTGKSCSPRFIHWAPDTWMCAHSIVPTAMQRGSKRWFFVGPDYAFGHALQRDASAFVKQGGGTVTGAVFYPFGATTDFSSFLLQAQSSGADIIGICGGSGDLQNVLKQAAEFGINQATKTKIAGFIVYLTDVHSVGLQICQGMLAAESFYWDMNDATRAFTKQIVAHTPNNYPQQEHAGAYAVTLHYLKCAASVGVAKAKASGLEMAGLMKNTPTEDKLFGRGSIREDGRWTGTVYVFQVKTPAESRGEWDLFKTLNTIPAAEAWRPLTEGGCALVKT